MDELREPLSEADRTLLHLAADELASEYRHRATEDDFYEGQPEIREKYAAEARRLLELAELLIEADEFVAITRRKP